MGADLGVLSAQGRRIEPRPSKSKASRVVQCESAVNRRVLRGGDAMCVCVCGELTRRSGRAWAAEPAKKGLAAWAD